MKNNKNLREKITDRRRFLNNQRELLNEENQQNELLLIAFVKLIFLPLFALKYLKIIAREKNSLSFFYTRYKIIFCVILSITFCCVITDSLQELSVIALILVYFFSTYVYINGAAIEQELEDCRFLFLRSGIVDGVGDSVEVMDIQNDEIIISCSGVAVKKIEERKKNLETALNLRIRNILPGSDHSTFIIKISHEMIPNYIEFGDQLTKLSRVKTEHWLIGFDGDIICSPLSELRNILINGACGSGKSVALRVAQTFLLIGSANLVEVYSADYKGGLEQNPFEPWLSAPVAQRDCLAIAIIDYIYNTLEYRLQLFSKASVTEIEEYRSRINPIPRIIFVVDEYADLKDSLDLIDKDLKKKKQLGYLQKIQSCARRGRALGIHLVFCTQYAEAAILDSQTKNNMTSRQVMKMYSTASSRNLLEDDSAFALPDIKGRHIFNNGGANLEVQGFWLSKPKSIDLLERYGQKKLISTQFLQFLRAKGEDKLLKQMQKENKKRLIKMRRK